MGEDREVIRTLEVAPSRSAPARLPMRRLLSPATGDGPSVLDLLRMLSDERWTILGVTGAVLALAVAYLLLAVPVYRSDVVVQVESRTKTLAGLEDITSLFSENTPAETEIELIESRRLVGAVVDELDLDIVARPLTPPLAGAIVRRHRGVSPAPARLGLDSYAWGGERLRVSQLSTSDDLIDEEMVLTALDGERFRLEASDGTLLLEGAVGERANATASVGRVEIVVSELVARPRTRFTLTKRNAVDVVEELQDALAVEEKGKKTGILLVALEGPDPQRVAATLNAISAAYVRHNVDRKSAEASATLAFLDQQLPLLKTRLEGAEAALNTFQLHKKTVSLSQETTATLERAVEVERALSEVDLERAELRQRFTDEHPSVLALARKMERLRAEQAAMATRMRGLPATELDSARLTRDVKVASELYTLFLNKAQELRVVKSGVVGNVSVVDPAFVPPRPVRPKRGLVLAAALLLGAALGGVVAITRRAFVEGAEDPDEIEEATGLAVYIAVPHSEREEQLERASEGRAAGAQVLAAIAPEDQAVESLRSLRTALQFALVEARNNVIAFGAPAPGAGKSFVCANLAYLLTATGRRVLLVDADLRRGRLHRRFSVDRRPGVSDVLCGLATLDTAVRRTASAELDLLPTGRIPPNPAELLATQAFQALLTAASRRYDLVLVDTPPVLAVTDPALVARHAGVNLLVLRAGQHPPREIALALKRLSQSGVEVQGAILNDVRSTHGRYGKHGRYYNYEYRSAPPDGERPQRDPPAT